MACVAVASLVRTIELEFLQYHPRPLVLHNHLISFNKELIQSFHQKLGFLISQLDEERINGVEAVKHLETKLRDLAFRVEDEIEFLVAHLYDIEEEDDVRIADLVLKEEKPQRDTDAEKTTQPCVKLGQVFQTAMEQIEAINEELLKIKNMGEAEGRKIAHDVLQRSEVLSSQHASHSKEQMVGKKDEFEIIKKLLTELGSKEKKVVSIIGTGGIGKTTLARQVYEDPSISIHFDVRAWVVASQLHNKRQMHVSLLISIVSQLHNKRQMLVSLLKSLSKLENDKEEFSDDVLALTLYECKEISDGFLALELYQCLKCQRYMVVIDDVWSDEACNDVKDYIPDDRNGSRVLLTTRLTKLANCTSSDNDFSHHMQLLDQIDSWNLFCEKVGKFRDAEFEVIGRPIVEKCKGLPLAIIVVAGLFSKLSTLNERENIAKVLDSSTTTIAATCSKILLLSYNHLPHHLKACFLYLGVFPEDYAINANELARLWSAEGLVKTLENENFDVVADRHIQELMDRNLILVSKRSCCGKKIKVFRVHDLLHAFCVKEAQKENLLHVIRENGSDFPQRCFRWVSIQSSNFDVSTLCYSSRSCRSFFCFSVNDIRLNWEQFKLLRVFFFTSYLMKKNIVDLVHLRYLPRALENHNIVKLFKAWNLQTLFICADDRNYLEFPQLQYFACLFMRRHSPKFVHQNLQCLSWLKPKRCTKEFFTHVPNVKKIRIAGERRECNDCIENLVNLQQLERLYINANEWHYTSPNIVQINSHIVLLKSLKRLRFQSNRFEWKGINVLCELPRLEVLKLSGACVGKQWELPEDEKFCQLIVLKIGSTDLNGWKATGDHFPKLEHLSLFSCKKLKEIPSGFAEISKLKSIDLADCRPSVVASAEKIKEEQLDYLNNIVDVVVSERRGYSQVSEPESDEYESDEA